MHYHVNFLSFLFILCRIINIFFITSIQNYKFFFFAIFKILNICFHQSQVEELKSIAFGCAPVKSSLLDPALNLLFEKMKRELDNSKTKLEETQNELAAWKFTPDRLDLFQFFFV